MSVVEFTDIKLARQPARTLLGFSIDSPQVGAQHPAEAVEVSGWVVGGIVPVEAVELAAGSGTRWRAETGLWRDDIARHFPAAVGAERSGFRARLDVTELPPEFELTVHAVLPDGSQPVIGHLLGRRRADASRRSATGHRSGAIEPDSEPVSSPPQIERDAAPRVTVVVPVHNQRQITRGCLDALLGGGGASVPFETVVVDDGSSDDTPELAAQYGQRIRMVRLDPFAGFASACNAGSAVARTEYIVFLHNDTIPQPGWLDALVAHTDAHPEAAIVGAKLLYPDGRTQHAGVSFNLDGYPHHIYAGFPSDHPAVNRTRRFKAVTAACCLVRSDVFRTLGGFDRTFVNGWEDIDLCLRVGEAGHEIHYCPSSVVFHLETAMGAGSSRELENRRHWASRWLGRVRSDCIDFWIADRLLAVDLLGPRYPIRVRVASELALRGLSPLFVGKGNATRDDGGHQRHRTRTSVPRFRPRPGTTRSWRHPKSRTLADA